MPFFLKHRKMCHLYISLLPKSHFNSYKSLTDCQNYFVRNPPTAHKLVQRPENKWMKDNKIQKQENNRFNKKIK